uniref:Uncharacterized protein n=1 Tax=Timema douglasi TaxID=61478 RepID=A0A7R8VP54_TIMDO|nr:unnamed protein product [Timema douglasi]
MPSRGAETIEQRTHLQSQEFRTNDGRGRQENSLPLKDEGSVPDDYYYEDPQETGRNHGHPSGQHPLLQPEPAKALGQSLGEVQPGPDKPQGKDSIDVYVVRNPKHPSSTPVPTTATTVVPSVVKAKAPPRPIEIPEDTVEVELVVDKENNPRGAILSLALEKPPEAVGKEAPRLFALLVDRNTDYLFLQDLWVRFERLAGCTQPETTSTSYHLAETSIYSFKWARKQMVRRSRDTPPPSLSHTMRY